jgi:hypothetical protein
MIEFIFKYYIFRSNMCACFYVPKSVCTTLEGCKSAVEVEVEVEVEVNLCQAPDQIFFFKDYYGFLHVGAPSLRRGWV